MPVLDQGKCKQTWDRRGVKYKSELQICAGYTEGRKGNKFFN